MAKAPTDRDRIAPEEFPQTIPRDLYPTSDIRFVLVRIGELSTKVDLLIGKSDKHGDKIDDLQHKVSFVKGAMWIIGGLIAFIGAVVIWYFSGKLSINIVPRP